MKLLQSETSRRSFPNVPFVQSHHVGGPQKPTSIVLDLSWTTSDEGSALGIAQWKHSPLSPRKSYHYVVDEAMTYRCIPHDVAAYGNPYRSLSVLICAQPQEQVSGWYESSRTKTLHRAADLVADLILIHKIKTRYLDKDEEQKWRKHRWRSRGGLIVKAPGVWPCESFLGDVVSQLVIKTM